jgi:hypothetical protein
MSRSIVGRGPLRSIRRRSTWLALPVLASLVPVGVAAASPAAAPNTFTFSGALKGKIVVNPTIDCDLMSTQAESLDWLSVKLAPYAPVDWSIQFKFPRYGTWSKFSVASATVLVEGAGHGAWQATSGTFTAQADAGSVNVTLEPYLGSNGTVHLTGNWHCA